jgi:hypothetical protein
MDWPTKQGPNTLQMLGRLGKGFKNSNLNSNFQSTLPSSAKTLAWGGRNLRAEQIKAFCLLNLEMWDVSDINVTICKSVQH